MTLDKKQIVCLALGCVFGLAVLSLGIWAATSGVLKEPSTSSDDGNEEMSTVEKQKLTSNDDDNIRIDTSLLNNSADNRRKPMPPYRVFRTTTAPPKSFFDLPDPLPRGRRASWMEPPTARGFIQNRDSSAEWATLSYLSLSLIVLKQLDRLLAIQDSYSSRRSFPSNSLNLLFIDPNRGRDIDDVMSTDADFNAGDYIRAWNNIIRAWNSPRREGIDCIWTAYCVEINQRANTLKGIAGTVARLNVAVMELAAGQLTPADSLSKWWRSLTTADTWQSLDCDAIFPKCQSTRALDYLVQLAAKNNNDHTDETNND